MESAGVNVDGYGKVGTIDANLEEPLTRWYYKVARRITKHVRVAPNIVTTLRLLTMVLLTTLFYYNRLPVLTALLVQVCFFLDHLDGEMARAHNLITEFGDYYDHVVDHVYQLPLIVILVWRLSVTPLFWLWIVVLLSVLYLSTTLVACQEVLMSERQASLVSTSLSGLQKMCPRKRYSENSISRLRYFGQSFLHLCIGAAMLYASYA